MSPLSNILAATDLSAPARHAAERAALVSKETGAPLALLHVANLAPLERLRQLMTVTSDDLQQRVLDAARSRLHELAATLLERYGITAGTRVVAGSLLAELTNAADGMAASLLVCGAKGESVVRHLLLGTTAERLLNGTTCPVLVVKQAPRGQYRTVLVPVDFSASSLRSIRHAQAVAPHAEIVLLHAFEEPFEGHLRYAGVDEEVINHYRVVAKQEATQKIRALSVDAGLPPHATRLIVIHGDPSLRIIEQEQEQDCDLIVMGKHGESMLEELLVGSVTKHVLADSQCDVLVSV
ncbi:MAG: universal stress protein [Azoarcus sp. PHD]|nr:MAG: universal stress protein [Azoarcus sp. PHD]